MILYIDPNPSYHFTSKYWKFTDYEIKILEEAGFEPYSKGCIYKHKFFKSVYIFASEFTTEEKIWFADSMPNYAYVKKIPIKLISVEQIKILAESISH